MNHRQFKLLNGLGQYQDLNNNQCFAISPSGFGYSKNLDMLRVGDDYSLIQSMINLDTKTFEVLFSGSNNAYTYQNYFNFVKFVSYKPLYLLYQRPNSDDWYRQKVEVVSLTKGDINSDDSLLHCNLTLQSLSFWEDDKEQVIRTGDVEGDGKTYPITYPITYSVNSLSNIQIKSISMLDTPLKITIDGNCSNPLLTLSDSNGSVYGKCKFLGTFDKVMINSNDKDEEVQLTYNGAILDNPLGYQDLTIGNPNTEYITFLKVKAGDNKLQLNVGLGFTGQVEVRWRNRYVSI